MQHSITLYKQIHPCQCSTLAKLGYKSLINLRFDDESDNQPKSQAIENSATDAGMTYHHLPVNADELDKCLLQNFAQLLKDTPKPVMVFCYSGGRAKRLYQSALISGLI